MNSSRIVIFLSFALLTAALLGHLSPGAAGGGMRLEIVGSTCHVSTMPDADRNYKCDIEKNEVMIGHTGRLDYNPVCCQIRLAQE